MTRPRTPLTCLAAVALLIAGCSQDTPDPEGQTAESPAAESPAAEEPAEDDSAAEDPAEDDSAAPSGTAEVPEGVPAEWVRHEIEGIELWAAPDFETDGSVSGVLGLSVEGDVLQMTITAGLMTEAESPGVTDVAIDEAGAHVMEAITGGNIEVGPAEPHPVPGAEDAHLSALGYEDDAVTIEGWVLVSQAEEGLRAVILLAGPDAYEEYAGDVVLESISVS